MVGGYREYDRNTCACECGQRVPHGGPVPPFAGEACREQWIKTKSIGETPAPTPEPVQHKAETPSAQLAEVPRTAPPPVVELVARPLVEVAPRSLVQRMLRRVARRLW